MRFTTLLFLSCLLYSTLAAQETEKDLPLRLGLFAPYATQWGMQVGTTIPLDTWRIESKKDKKLSKSLFAQPQMGIYARADNHLSLLVSSDFGLRKVNENNRFYTAYSLGLGYLNIYQTISIPINLGNGEVNERNRERTGYFLPTIKAELGKIATEKWGWFANVSFGRNMSTAKENSAFVAVEGGLSINIFRVKK